MTKHALRARQVAYRLGLRREAAAWIEERARAGEIPHVEVAGEILFDLESVDRALSRLAAGEVDSLACVGSEVALPEVSL